MYFVFETYEDAYDALPQFESDVAKELREAAKQYRRDAHESFERCDTDGFLSQWAFGVTASQREREADLADNGNLGLFPALLDESGQVHARVYKFPHKFNPGACSAVFKVQRGERAEWVNANYKRDSSYAERGLRKVWIIAPARVMPDPFNRMPEKRGLSGCAGYTGEYARLDADAAGL